MKEEAKTKKDLIKELKSLRRKVNRLEKSLLRLNHVMRAISNCNQTLLQAVDEYTLLTEICRIICEEAGYPLAWVGYIEYCEAGTIRPVAWAGIDSRYIADSNLFKNNSSVCEAGLTGKAIQSGTITYVRDFNTNPEMTPWFESQLQHGYRSGVALPLKDENTNVFGVLQIYSREPDAITQDEIRSLEELAIELAIGITALHNRTERMLMEAEVRETEERFRMVFENAFDGISIYTNHPDPFKRKLVECNKQYAAMAGRSREELLKLGNTQTLQIPLKDNTNETRIESLDTGTTHKGSFSWIRPDGRENVIEYVGKSINWRGKAYTFGIDRDVTERKQVEYELRKLSRAVEQSPASVIITDTKGNIEYINPKVTEITGYQFSELVGNNPRIFKSGEKSKSDYKVLWDSIISGKEWHGELRNKKKNGELYWVSVSISPILNEKGEVTHFLAIEEDITNRIITEENLIKERDLLQALLDNIPDLIYFKDKDSRFTRVNKSEARVLGISDPEEAIGKNDFDFFELEHAAAAYEDEQKIMKSKIPLIAKVELIRVAEGQHRWFTATKVPIINNKGKCTGLVGISRDINSAKLSEEKLELYSKELKELNAGKDKLFSIIAHDLRGPFNPLLGISEILVNDFESLSTEKLKYYHKEIHKALKNEYTLLENLLNWSRLETGQMKFNPMTIRLHDTTESVINLLSENAKVKVITLLNKTSKDIFVSADPNMLYSVLQNLIANSIKFTNNGGEIKIYSEDAGNDSVQVTVSDNGVGMTKDHTKDLFGFSAASTNGTNNEKGTGLGLMICKEMVELHSGTISVKSEKGKGTDISFTLPKSK
jgi:PAS domain S-box-containing protein